jgi:GTP cyclohydrolase I
MRVTKVQHTDNLNTFVSFLTNEEVREKLMMSKERIGRAYDELFSGYRLRAEDVLNEVVRVEFYAGLVIVDGIQFYSMCEHHFLPFFGTASVTYQPGQIITGLGKIARLVRDVHARRLQIQETMTRDIAQDMKRVLEAKGVFVKTRAKHLCMCSRGPADDVAETEVFYGIGSLENWWRRPEVREP